MNDTGAMAREMYQKMCEYVGSDHEGKCIEYIKFTLDSFDAEIENQKKKNALIRTATLDKVLDIGEDILCSYPANMTKRGDATKDYMEAIGNLRGESDDG